MKKKSILMAAIAVMLVAVLVVGGTLAYFTDTKSATNTFTMGNVKIALDEQQKGENGLEPFEQNKQLVPGKSNDGNAVSKIVTVKNTGANDAWVWVELKIPKYLVSKEYPTNESKNALHWNSYGCFNVEYNSGNYWGLATSDGIVDADHNVTDPKMVAVGDGLWNDYKYRCSCWRVSWRSSYSLRSSALSCTRRSSRWSRNGISTAASRFMRLHSPC